MKLNVSSLPDLLLYFANEHPDLTLKEVAKLIGISEKYFFEIRKGVVPGENVIRKLNGYLINKKGAAFKITKGNRIEIQDLSGNNNIVAGANVNNSNVDRERYLLDKMMQLEDEVRELKEENSKLKTKKQ